MTVFRLPFPYIQGAPGSGLGNPEDFADAIQSNLDALAASLGPVAQTQPTRVTTLPASPFDGQEIYYVADATNGIVWHLKYRAASGSSYKWEFVGGPPLFAEVTTPEAASSTTYANVDSGGTVGPSLTVPLAGDYDIGIHFRVFNNSSSRDNYMSYAIGGTAANDADAIDYFSSDVGALGSTAMVSLARTRRKTALAASTALVAKYKVTAGTATVANRSMQVCPVRVG